MSTDSTFDGFADAYEEACHKGLSLTGEGREFFAKARVQLTAAACQSDTAIVRVLDFGCGVGHATRILRATFPGATVFGVDNSVQSINRAVADYGCEQAVFSTAMPKCIENSCDLAYCNGVFHHIPPSDRLTAARDVFTALRPGGWFAFWENNPWNPGTRLVMSRIPFDRDAILLRPSEAGELLASAGFSILATTYHFFFPAFLSFLRPLESAMSRLPLGGQYCVLAAKRLL